jgi:hypothetical protein
MILIMALFNADNLPKLAWTPLILLIVERGLNVENIKRGPNIRSTSKNTPQHLNY